MIMKNVNWWKVIYEVVKVILLALAGGGAVNSMM